MEHLYVEESCNQHRVDYDTFVQRQDNSGRRKRRSEREENYEFLWGTQPATSWIATTPVDMARRGLQKVMLRWHFDDFKMLDAECETIFDLYMSTTVDQLELAFLLGHFWIRLP